MTDSDDEPTGPWVLALGALAIAVGAAAALLRRRDSDHEGRRARPLGRQSRRMLADARYRATDR